MATLFAPVLRRHLSADGIAGAFAAAAGWVSGRCLSVRHLLPGIAGGMAVSLGAGEVCGHVFGHGLVPWVTVLTAGVFALALDKRL